jgi:hypothetical protein
VVSVLDIGTNVHRFKPGRVRGIFKGDKNPWHDFLLMGSKAVCPKRFYVMLKNPTDMKIDTSQAKFTAISRQVSLNSPLRVSARYCQGALLD